MHFGRMLDRARVKNKCMGSVCQVELRTVFGEGRWIHHLSTAAVGGLRWLVTTGSMQPRHGMVAGEACTGGAQREVPQGSSMA